MPNDTLEKIKSYIAELDARAAKAQADAHTTLNPLFQKRDDRKKPPRDFVDSSYLFMRSCDADAGNRPIPCPVFWLSPDLRVSPLSNIGAPTRELRAGDTYRITATVRNRGDLMVPSAKVEFWLVTPSLGFDVRFATKLGVAAERVQAFGATEVSLDYTVPASVSGHRCLFARVFSFSPLDIPVDDFALNPVIDRHVAQLNLNITAQVSAFRLDWIHPPNATERLEIAPMDTASKRALRVETMAPLTLVSSTRAKDLIGKLGIEVFADDRSGAVIKTTRTALGIELVSVNPKAVPLERQAALTKQVQAAIATLERGRGGTDKYRQLFTEYRAMTAQAVRTQVQLALPDVGLTAKQGVALHIVRRDIASKKILGGIALVVTGT